MTSSPISPVSTQDYLLARLAAVSDGRRSPRQLAGDLKTRLAAEHWSAAIDTLAARRWILPDESKVTLSPTGRREVVRRFGTLERDAGRMARRIEPALCLGCRPDSTFAARLVRPDTLRAIVLTRVYQLPLDEARVTLSQAIGSLLVRGMSGLSPDESAPEVREAARHITADLSDIARLRQALLCLALQFGLTRARTPGVAPRSAASPGLRQFAQHVVNIAQTAHTGPFAHKTPVGHLYDEYGRRHADAGTLSQFKQRLLQASKAGLLALLPLDDPRAMDASARERSEIAVASGALHFVERGL